MASIIEQTTPKFVNDLKAAFPIHEGEILKDELVARKMSQKEFSVRIGYSYSTVNKICNQKARMPDNMCVGLQYVFGVESQFWFNLKRNYDEWFLDKNPIKSSIDK